MDLAHRANERVPGRHWQSFEITPLEVDQCFETLTRLKGEAVHRTGGGQGSGETDLRIDQRGDIQIVLGFNSLEKHLDLRREQIVERGDLDDVIVGRTGFANLADRQAAEERDIDEVVRVISGGNLNREGVRLVL